MTLLAHVRTSRSWIRLSTISVHPCSLPLAIGLPSAILVVLLRLRPFGAGHFLHRVRRRPQPHEHQFHPHHHRRRRRELERAHGREVGGDGERGVGDAQGVARRNHRWHAAQVLGEEGGNGSLAQIQDSSRRFQRSSSCSSVLTSPVNSFAPHALSSGRIHQMHYFQAK